jgi:hypothetical protein
MASIGDENANCAPAYSSRGVASMTKRRRFNQQSSLEDRLASFAKEARERAAELAPGTEKDDLLRKARQADTASHLNEWANSAGLQPPTK